MKRLVGLCRRIGRVTGMIAALMVPATPLGVMPVVGAHGVVTVTVLRTIRIVVPWAVAVDERTGHVFVASWFVRGSGRTMVRGGAVSMLDARTGRVLGTTDVGPLPWQIAIDEQTGRAFVANDGDGTVSVLDAHSGALLRTVAPTSRTMHRFTMFGAAVAVDARAGHVFVVTQGPILGMNKVPNGPGTLSMLDARTGALLSSASIGVNPRALAIDEQTSRAVVLTAGPIVAPGTFVGAGRVHIFDTRTGALLHTSAVGLGPGALVVDGHLGRAYVVNAGPALIATDPGIGIGGRPLARGTVSVLDVRTGAVLHTLVVGKFPGAIALDEQTGRAFVANGFGNSVSVLDAGAGTVVRIVPVGQGPGQVVVDRCAHRAYVLNLEASADASHGSVSVLDTTSGGVLATVPVGSGPRDIAVDLRTSRAFVVNNTSNSVSVLATAPEGQGAACA